MMKKRQKESLQIGWIESFCRFFVLFSPRFVEITARVTKDRMEKREKRERETQRC